MYDVAFDAAGLPAEEIDRRGPPQPRNDRPLIGVLLLIVFLAVECGVAFAAWRLHPATDLGNPVALVPTTWRLYVRTIAILGFGIAASLSALSRGRRVAAAMLVVGLAAAPCAYGSLYSPMQLVSWQTAAARAGASMTPFYEAGAVSALASVLGGLLAVAAWRSATAIATTDSHGSNPPRVPPSRKYQREARPPDLCTDAVVA